MNTIPSEWAQTLLERLDASHPLFLTPSPELFDLLQKLKAGEKDGDDDGDDKNPIAKKAKHLAYLCAAGALDKSHQYLDAIQEKEEILNYPLSKFNNGTVLHVALDWNKDRVGHRFFDFLVHYGAKPIKDQRGYLPWEQKAEVWIDPVTLTKMGQRIAGEFDVFYSEIETKVRESTREKAWHI